jgi:hypothetical protein
VVPTSLPHLAALIHAWPGSRLLELEVEQGEPADLAYWLGEDDDDDDECPDCPDDSQCLTCGRMP